MHQVKQNWRYRVFVLAMLVAAFFLGSAMRTSSDVHADSRRARTEKPAPTHFESGGARSETVLVEISATLKRIETRLERLEDVARAFKAAGE